MTTIWFDHGEKSHPISVRKIEANGRTFYDVDFIKNMEHVQEIVSFDDPFRFDEKGYGPQAKSMQGINLLIAMWKSINKHFKLN